MASARQCFHSTPSIASFSVNIHNVTSMQNNIRLACPTRINTNFVGFFFTLHHIFRILLRILVRILKEFKRSKTWRQILTDSKDFSEIPAKLLCAHAGIPVVGIGIPVCAGKKGGHKKRKKHHQKNQNQNKQTNPKQTTTQKTQTKNKTKKKTKMLMICTEPQCSLTLQEAFSMLYIR